VGRSLTMLRSGENVPRRWNDIGALCPDGSHHQTARGTGEAGETCFADLPWPCRDRRNEDPARARVVTRKGGPCVLLPDLAEGFGQVRLMVTRTVDWST
jgi:hypothetical protein